MPRIVLNQVACGLICGVKPYSPRHNEQYNKLVLEANKRIDLAQNSYASACIKASKYLSD